MTRATQLGFVWAFRDALRVITKHTGEAMQIGREMEGVIEKCRSGNLKYAESVREFKKRYVSQVLIDRAFNQSSAARELGMHRNTLARIIAELEIDVQVLRGRKPIQSVELAQAVARQA